MAAYILRRLFQSVLTILGVMLLTFLLFRVVSGDIAAAHVGVHATEQMKADWRHKYGYDRPELLNFHRQLLIVDRSVDPPGPEQNPPKVSPKADNALALIPSDRERSVRMGRYVFRLSRQTPISKLTHGAPLEGEPPVLAFPGAQTPQDAPSTVPAEHGYPQEAMTILLAGGQRIVVDVAGVQTAGELLDRINGASGNRDPGTGRALVEARFSDWSAAQVLDSQFADHLYKSVMFQGRSLKTNEGLTEIIANHAFYSLALTVPAMAIGWLLDLVIASIVAYYRGRLVDKVGVFLSVLGMCVPVLAFMIYGQWLVFQIAPDRAYGLMHRSNIYVPVVIMVVAGLGGSVRFYRTVILDEVNRDYVRTARAKGASLPAVLFKHVLKNCMLPILTNLIMAIPFLILGSLLMESYFGIPGLGDLLLSSINGRDEPIMSGMVFLTALIYTVGVLLTDISYAVFDPRIRLQ